MPYKSRKQSRFFFAAVKKGEIPESTAKEWASKTNFKSLPEKVKHKKK